MVNQEYSHNGYIKAVFVMYACMRTWLLANIIVVTLCVKLCGIISCKYLCYIFHEL